MWKNHGRHSILRYYRRSLGNLQKNKFCKPRVERVDLDNCHNRILAVDLPSLVDDPPFDNSAMDGFAMRHEDTLNSPSKLKIIGTIQAAGQEDNSVVGEGQAVRIMTGAPLPEGADSILQIELTSVDGLRSHYHKNL